MSATDSNIKYIVVSIDNKTGSFNYIVGDDSTKYIDSASNSNPPLKIIEDSIDNPNENMQYIKIKVKKSSSQPIQDSDAKTPYFELNKQWYTLLLNDYVNTNDLQVVDYKWFANYGSERDPFVIFKRFYNMDLVVKNMKYLFNLSPEDSNFNTKFPEINDNMNGNFDAIQNALKKPFFAIKTVLDMQSKIDKIDKETKTSKTVPQFFVSGRDRYGYPNINGDKSHIIAALQLLYDVRMYCPDCIDYKKDTEYLNSLHQHMKFRNFFLHEKDNDDTNILDFENLLNKVGNLQTMIMNSSTCRDYLEYFLKNVEILDDDKKPFSSNMVIYINEKTKIKDPNYELIGQICKIKDVDQYIYFNNKEGLIYNDVEIREDKTLLYWCEEEKISLYRKLGETYKDLLMTKYYITEDEINRTKKVNKTILFVDNFLSGDTYKDSDIINNFMKQYLADKSRKDLDSLMKTAFTGKMFKHGICNWTGELSYFIAAMQMVYDCVPYKSGINYDSQQLGKTPSIRMFEFQLLNLEYCLQRIFSNIETSLNPLNQTTTVTTPDQKQIEENIFLNYSICVNFIAEVINIVSNFENVEIKGSGSSSYPEYSRKTVLDNYYYKKVAYNLLDYDEYTWNNAAPAAAAMASWDVWNKAKSVFWFSTYAAGAGVGAVGVGAAGAAATAAGAGAVGVGAAATTIAPSAAAYAYAAGAGATILDTIAAAQLTWGTVATAGKTLGLYGLSSLGAAPVATVIFLLGSINVGLIMRENSNEKDRIAALTAALQPIIQGFDKNTLSMLTSNKTLPDILKNKCVELIHKLIPVLFRKFNVFIDFVEDGRPIDKKIENYKDGSTVKTPNFVILIGSLPRTPLIIDASFADLCSSSTAYTPAPAPAPAAAAAAVAAAAAAAAIVAGPAAAAAAAAANAAAAPGATAADIATAAANAAAAAAGAASAPAATVVAAATAAAAAAAAAAADIAAAAAAAAGAAAAAPAAIAAIAAAIAAPAPAPAPAVAPVVAPYNTKDSTQALGYANTAHTNVPNFTRVATTLPTTVTTLATTLEAIILIVQANTYATQYNRTADTLSAQAAAAATAAAAAAAANVDDLNTTPGNQKAADNFKDASTRLAAAAAEAKAAAATATEAAAAAAVKVANEASATAVGKNWIKITGVPYTNANAEYINGVYYSYESNTTTKYKHTEHNDVRIDITAATNEWNIIIKYTDRTVPAGPVDSNVVLATGIHDYTFATNSCKKNWSIKDTLYNDNNVGTSPITTITVERIGATYLTSSSSKIPKENLIYHTFQNTYQFQSQKYSRVGTIYKSAHHEYYYKYYNHVHQILLSDCEAKYDVSEQQIGKDMFPFIQLYKKDGYKYSDITTQSTDLIYADVVNHFGKMDSK